MHVLKATTFTPATYLKFKLYCVLIHVLMVNSRDDFNICIELTWIEITLYDRKPYGGPPRIMTKPWCLFNIPPFTFAHFFFLNDCSYHEADSIVSIPVPASPSVSERTSPPPASPSRQAFLDHLFDFHGDVSIRQKLYVIKENQKQLFKLFSSAIQERKDSVCHCNNCKAGRDQKGKILLIQVGQKRSQAGIQTQLK